MERGGEGTGTAELSLEGPKGPLWPGLSTRPSPALGCGSDLAVAHDQDAVTAEDGGDAVGDDQHCAAPEGLADRVLDQRVGRHVNGGCRFVNDDDLGGTEEEWGQPPWTPSPSLVLSLPPSHQVP